MRRRLFQDAWLLVCALPMGMPALGCGTDAAQEEPVGSSRAKEEFNSNTDPAYMIQLINSSPVLKADELVESGDLGRVISVKTDSRPFSGSYWPMSQNGILFRYMRGIASPAEKYGQLFLSDSEQQDMYSFIETHHGRKVPNMRSWFGICQGWAGSAVAEQAPQHAINVRKKVGAGGDMGIEPCSRGDSGCVNITPGDLTGLLAEAYSQPDARFAGDRCGTEPSAFSYDSAGRISQPSCRSNAGTLFLLATNIIKKAGKAFVASVTNNEQIWNQPVYAYRLNRYDKVSEAQAANLVGRGSSYSWDTNAVAFRYVELTLTWTVEAGPTVNTPPPVQSTSKNYGFILELNGNGAVLGGEWVGHSKTDHPPFFWAPAGPGTEVPHLQYKLVKALLEASQR